MLGAVLNKDCLHLIAIEKSKKVQTSKWWCFFFFRSCIKGIICYGFVCQKQSTGYSAFKCWNVYRSTFVQGDQIWCIM